MKLAKTLTVAALGVGALGLLPSPASAATVVEKTRWCSTDAAKVKVVFSVEDNATPYGSFLNVQGIAEGEFRRTPSMKVTVYDALKRPVLVGESADGSLSVDFQRSTIDGRYWSAVAKVMGTADGSCTTRPVRVSLT